MKRFIITVLVVAGLLFAVPFGADRVLLAQDQRYAKQQEPRLHKEYSLIQRANELGIDVTAINLYIGYDEATSLDSAQATFTPPNTITVQPGLTASEQRQLLAHEYLHYIWTTQEHTESVTQTYVDSIQTDPWIARVMSQYTNCDRLCLADEVHSYSCTAEPPEYLDADFNRYCNSLIPNRAILF